MTQQDYLALPLHERARLVFAENVAEARRDSKRANGLRKMDTRRCRSLLGQLRRIETSGSGYERAYVLRHYRNMLIDSLASRRYWMRVIKESGVSNDTN